jgi:phenylalanyl-tRNA synthetase beta chain
MKLSPHWLRDFVDFTVDYRRLADELTLAGIAVEGISGEGDATVFEMEITTNRPDAMNHYGVAREVSALYDLPLKPVEPELPAAKAGAVFPIEIEATQLCPRFTARVLRGVTIQPSPAKIASRLALIDQRPINNAVDATNYVLWEIGKPTHVFDLDLLEGGKLIVRHAREGEVLKTLDGVVRKLTPDDLVVADARKPVALAGVMGGFDTMITEETRNLLIESAWWDPAVVRRMSRRHGLHTDASHRFERGADFESTVVSCNRVAELILKSGGGELAGGVADVVARVMDQAPVALHIAEVHRILGKDVEVNRMLRILRNLGCDAVPERRDSTEFTVLVPSWRLDIEREIDLIEEIARLHGYDKFANTLPAWSGEVVELDDARKDGRLRAGLLALGYNEAISLTFTSEGDAKQFSAAGALALANPLSAEASVMRTSLLPGMLQMLAWNLNRGVEDVRLFEAGHVFASVRGECVERERLCLGATGSAGESSVHQPGRQFSFFDLKGDIETLLVGFACSSLKFEAGEKEYFHSGRSARAVVDGVPVAEFGQLHPVVASARKLKQEIYVAEIYLDRLYQHDLRQVRYTPLAKFPAVTRDFSFVFADAVRFEEILAALTALGLAELRSVVPAEIFRGGNVPAGKYSLLLRAIFQSSERTLREEEVAAWSTQMVQTLEKLGGTLRA